MNFQTLLAASASENVARALLAFGGPVPEANLRLAETVCMVDPVWTCEGFHIVERSCQPMIGKNSYYVDISRQTGKTFLVSLATWRKARAMHQRSQHRNGYRAPLETLPPERETSWARSVHPGEEALETSRSESIRRRCEPRAARAPGPCARRRPFKPRPVRTHRTYRVGRGSSQIWEDPLPRTGRSRAAQSRAAGALGALAFHLPARSVLAGTVQLNRRQTKGTKAGQAGMLSRTLLPSTNCLVHDSRPAARRFLPCPALRFLRFLLLGSESF